MTKPTVTFIPPAEFHEYTRDDNEKVILANVYTLNHPRLGSQNVRTSIVLKVNEDESFETLNTIYVPYKNESLNQERNTTSTTPPATPV